VGEDRTPFEQRRVTVAEAADALGISAEAVRMRVRRGTLRSEHVEGTVYVLLDADQTQHVADTSTDRTDLLIAELQDRVRSLEEANRENRRIIAALTSRIPAIESPETVEEASERAGPQSGTTEGPQTGTERRSWWQFWR
jgi:DNA-binding Lrp family transcriptional regulator